LPTYSVSLPMCIPNALIMSLEQGIHESAPMSACLRFAIEFSRLRMLRAMQSVSPAFSSLDTEIMLQKSVADRWKGRYVFPMDL